MARVKKFLILGLVCALIAVGRPAFAGREDVLKKVRVMFLREEYQKVDRECERLLLRKRLDSSVKAELYYLRGVSFLKQNKFAKAKQNLLRLISRYARTDFIDDAFLSLGDCYLLSGDINNALKRYHMLLSKYPKTELVHLAYYRLGECYYRVGRWSEARKYLGKVIEKYPQSYEAGAARTLLDAGLYFTVQVGAFVNKGNAEALYRKLKNKKYAAHLSSFDKKGRTFYRVRVGKFDLREQAKLMKRRLKRNGFSAQISP